MPVEAELEPQAVEAPEQQPVAEQEASESLVEEVSIDGMCGVY